ncbi:MAG TPA: hypothetical protein VEY10_15435 [Flavisolibacter sp.]|nr:hypothetical protein [Flavisolibacter sp.]
MKTKYINILHLIAAQLFGKANKHAVVNKTIIETGTYKIILGKKMQSVKSRDSAYRSISAMIQ